MGIRGRHHNFSRRAQSSDSSKQTGSPSPHSKVSPFAEFVQAPPVKSGRGSAETAYSNRQRRRGSAAGVMVDDSQVLTPLGGGQHTPMTGYSGKSANRSIGSLSPGPESCVAGTAFKHHIQQDSESARSDATYTDSEGDADDYDHVSGDRHSGGDVSGNEEGASDSLTDSDGSDQARRRPMRGRLSVDADNHGNLESSESYETSDTDQKDTEEDDSDDDGVPYRYVPQQYAKITPGQFVQISDSADATPPARGSVVMGTGMVPVRLSKFIQIYHVLIIFAIWYFLNLSF